MLRAEALGVDLREIRFIAKGAGYYFASWRQAYVLDWRAVPTLESLDAAVDGKAAVLANHPDGVVVFNILRADSELPSSAVRKHAEKKQLQDVVGVLCHATVVDAEGFWAAGTRSMIAGLYLVSRSPFPRKVFATVDEAAKWQATFAPGTPGFADGLFEAVRLIRSSR